MKLYSIALQCIESHRIASYGIVSYHILHRLMNSPLKT